MRKFGLIGYPLGHSFSETFFKEKFSKEGIEDAIYENYPIENIDQFEVLYKNDPELKGLNVTIPYKETVIPYLDVLSAGAREIGAVNTICLCTKTGKFVKVGHNTDVIGFRKSLEEQADDLPEKALVLGTGGSSKAVMFVLNELEIETIQVSRSKKEGVVTYEEVTPAIVEECRLVVNTTPLGMFPDTESCAPIPYEGIGKDHLLFDLVYNPKTTLFMKKGLEKGATIVNGSDMLIYQAEASWEIWNR